MLITGKVCYTCLLSNCLTVSWAVSKVGMDLLRPGPDERVVPTDNALFPYAILISSSSLQSKITLIAMEGIPH